MRTNLGMRAAVTMLLGCAGSAAWAADDGAVDKALAMSKKTGRPILAVAGSET